MSIDYNPNATFLGAEWPVIDASSFQASSMAQAFVQPFRFGVDDSGGAGGSAMLNAVEVFTSKKVGGGIYAIEIVAASDLVPTNQSFVEEPPDTVDTSPGIWVVTAGGGTLLTSIEDSYDGVEVPNDDVTYVTSAPANLKAAYDTLFTVDDSVWSSPLQQKRIGYVEVVARCRGGSVGASLQSVFKLNGVIRPSSRVQSPSLLDWKTKRWRWSYNPESSKTQWPWGDARGFIAGGHEKFGLRSTGVVDLSSLWLKVGYGDELRIGAFKTGLELEEGWTNVPYDAELTAGDLYYLIVSPVVVDAANYNVFPLLKPSINADHEAFYNDVTADGFLGDLAKHELGGTAPFLLHKKTVEGQVYVSAALAQSDAAGENMIYAGRTETQLATADSNLDVDLVKLVVSAPSGQPSTDLTIEVRELDDTVLATATVLATSAPSAPTEMIVQLDDTVSLVDTTQYKLVLASTASQARPWRVARLRSLEQTDFRMLTGLPTSVRENQDAAWFKDGLGAPTDLVDAVDDAIGYPDDLMSYAQGPALKYLTYHCAPPDTTSETIAFVDVVVRCGTGALDLDLQFAINHSGSHYIDDLSTVRVPTAWNTFYGRFYKRPWDNAAWQKADIDAFADAGANSLGVRHMIFSGGAGDNLVTQCYMRVGVEPGDRPDALSFGGVDDYESHTGDASPTNYRDLVLAVGAKPSVVAGVDAEAKTRGIVTVTWTASGAGNFDHYQLYRRCTGETAWRKVDEGAIYDVDTVSFDDYTAPLGRESEWAVSQVLADGSESVVATATATPVSFYDRLDSNARPDLGLAIVLTHWPHKMKRPREEKVHETLDDIFDHVDQALSVRGYTGEITIEFWGDPDVPNAASSVGQYDLFETLRKTLNRIWLRERNGRLTIPVVLSEPEVELETADRLRVQAKFTQIDESGC